MKPIFAWHVSGQEDGQTPQFRIALVGPGADDQTDYLKLEDARLPSMVLDRLSKGSAPAQWYETREAVLTGFHQAKGVRG